MFFRTTLRLWIQAVVCLLVLGIGLGQPLGVLAGTTHHHRTTANAKQSSKSRRTTHKRRAIKKRTQATRHRKTVKRTKHRPTTAHAAKGHKTRKRLRKTTRHTARHLQNRKKRHPVKRPVRHRKRRRQHRRRPLIVIDPGHGGRDPGAMARGLTEKKLTLRLAKRLSRELRRRGFRTRLTRTRDVWVPVLTRAKRAARWHPDLFVSIHCNCGPSPEQNGLETFAYLPKRARPGRKLQIPLDDAEDVDTTATRAAKSTHSAWLRLAKPLGWNDGGVRLGRLAVLSVPGYPAVLFELGYLTNRKDARRLRSSRARRKLVRALARALAKQFVRGRLRP